MLAYATRAARCLYDQGNFPRVTLPLIVWFMGKENLWGKGFRQLAESMLEGSR